jgi:hypothetical protein
MDASVAECSVCRQPLDPTDRFCRKCGTPLGSAPGFGWLRRAAPSPEQAAGYWRGFFRPFFITAFIFFGVFFAFALAMVAVWFLMFRA